MIVTVRPANPDDYAAVEQLAREIHAQHVTARPDFFRMSDPVLPEEHFDSLLSGDASTLFVAEYDAAIAGYAICAMRQTPSLGMRIPRTSAIVDTVVVTQSLRGEGIGRALMDACAEWARNNGATTLELSVWEFNRDAIAFYERLGMETLTRRMSLPLTEASR
jgi:diamine N-acetyltransferase